MSAATELHLPTAPPDDELDLALLAVLAEFRVGGISFTQAVSEIKLAHTHHAPDLLALEITLETRYGFLIGPLVGPDFDVGAWVASRWEAARTLGVTRIHVREIRRSQLGGVL